MVIHAPYTVVSLFCGIGGLDLGFEYADFHIIWANDISANATKSYAKNFKITPICGDITEISIEKIPPADVIIGGPPCQSFSLVGMRRPEDNRGRLVFHFLDIVRDRRPSAFIMENVPGIAASRINGRRLTNILCCEFSKIGYKVKIIKLNAANYLVPQRRARIFILGSRETYIQEPNPVLFARDCYNLDSKAFDLSARAAIGDLGDCVSKGQLAEYKCTPHSQFSRLMRLKEPSRVTLHECPRMSETDKNLVRHIPYIPE